MAVMNYRTQDGRADYGFSIEFQQDKGWRIFIIFDPFQESENNNPHLPYQAFDHGRRYVDWPPRLDNLGDARTVAALWAELAQSYNHTHEEKRQYTERARQHQYSQEKRRDTNTAENPHAPRASRTTGCSLIPSEGLGYDEDGSPT
jgi:hypothetical protein